MNLTDFQLTGLYAVYNEVERHTAQHGIGIAGTELIGLMPRAAIEEARDIISKIGKFRQPEGSLKTGSSQSWRAGSRHKKRGRFMVPLARCRFPVYAS